MSALRLLSAARRTPLTIALSKRGYAEISDKIKLSLVLPHQVRVLSPASVTHLNEHFCRQSSPRQMSLK